MYLSKFFIVFFSMFFTFRTMCFWKFFSSSSSCYETSLGLSWYDPQQCFPDKVISQIAAKAEQNCCIDLHRGSMDSLDVLEKIAKKMEKDAVAKVKSINLRHCQYLKELQLSKVRSVFPNITYFDYSSSGITTVTKEDLDFLQYGNRLNLENCNKLVTFPADHLMTIPLVRIDIGGAMYEGGSKESFIKNMQEINAKRAQQYLFRRIIGGLGVSLLVGVAIYFFVKLLREDLEVDFELLKKQDYRNFLNTIITQYGSINVRRAMYLFTEQSYLISFDDQLVNYIDKIVGKYNPMNDSELPNTLAVPLFFSLCNTNILSNVTLKIGTIVYLCNQYGLLLSGILAVMSGYQSFKYIGSHDIRCDITGYFE